MWSANRMPGNGPTHQSSSSRHGSPTINEDSFALPKDISKIHSIARRLNDYTTVPRRPRAPPRYQENLADLIHVKTNASCESSDELLKCQPRNVTSVQEQKKDKSWSFRKLRNALKRSKSLKHENNGEAKESDSSCSSASESRVSGVLFSSAGITKGHQTTAEESKHVELEHKYKDNDDTYAAIDNLRSGYSLKDLTGCVMCRSGQSESGSNMAVTLPVHTSIHGYGRTHAEPSQRSTVPKATSSLTTRNGSTRKKCTLKQKTELDNDWDEFNRDNYRASFKDDTCGKRLANTDCKRSKSFSATTSDKPQKNILSHEPCGVTSATEIYSKQTEYETRDSEVLYSLAKSDDEPPPLPERTYLKLRGTETKENTCPSYVPRTELMENSTRTGPTFALQEQNNNYKTASYPNTIPEHVRLHSNKTQQKFEHNTAKPFMLHSHLRQEHDQCTVSSGYSSESDYSHMPAPLSRPECTLPKRSHHVLPIKPLPSVPGLPGYYSNRNSELHAHSEQQVRLRRPSPGRLDDDGTNGSITSNVIHNLPLPPGPGGAQLIRTLQLDRILKSKWISGIAVTKKNEYIVVDQREAYLLDEEGTLKKLIGAKGSNKLIEPFNVCVNPSNGNLVICDHADQDIKIFTWKGQFLKRVKDPALTNIAGVAVTDSKDIVIAGTDKQRVSVLADDGRLSYTIPSMTDGAARNKNRTPFEHPYSLAVNPLTGDIIIGDDYKQLVTAVSPSRDGQDPRVMWRYCPGPGDRHFFPSSICVDPKGYIFIADLYNEKVYMLDSSGKFVKTLLSRGDGLKGGPGAIAADGRGHLLVADEEKVIKVFKYRDENGFAINKRYSYCPQAT